jgi:hypothetical protein
LADGHVHLPALDVVLDRVLDEVADQPLEQRALADHPGRGAN